MVLDECPKLTKDKKILSEKRKKTDKEINEISSQIKSLEAKQKAAEGEEAEQILNQIKKGDLVKE